MKPDKDSDEDEDDDNAAKEVATEVSKKIDEGKESFEDEIKEEKEKEEKKPISRWRKQFPIAKQYVNSIHFGPGRRRLWRRGRTSNQGTTMRMKRKAHHRRKDRLRSRGKTGKTKY